MKITERMVRFALCMMIALSFYLSYLIWWSPATKTTLVNEVESESQAELNVKEASEIFLPLRLTRIEKETIAETNTESLIKKFQTNIADAQFETAHSKTYDSVDDFIAQTQLDEGVELVYAAAFPIQSYLDTFHVTIPMPDEMKAETGFLRIQIDFNKEKIRFLNRNKLTVLEANVVTGMNEFKHTIKNNAAVWIDVFRDPQYSLYQYYTNEPITLKMYSYISSTRPYTVFRDSFFSNPKNVRSNDGTANLNFYDGTESMTIQQEQQQIDFRSVIRTDSQFDSYAKSYDYIRGLGTNYGSLRLFDQTKNTSDYRIFVEGFPVFSDKAEGKMTVRFSENGQVNQKNIEIKANLNTIQVPIPSDREVTLPASYDVVQNLYAHGAQYDKLEMILIGYGWKNIQDTGVVDLEPNWYIQYDNTWYSYAQLLTHLAESGEKNGF